MGLLLDCAYLLACVLASPWILYRLLLAPGRRDFGMRFGLGLPAPRQRSIWLHASSVGEVTLLKPLVALIERGEPGTPLVISAFTSTGLATARKLYSQHTVVPLPLDLSFIVRRALGRFDPKLVVIAESELWPNFIRLSHERGADVAVVNGKMSAKSQRKHARRGVIRRVLADVDLFAVQTEEHAARFCSLGVLAERVRITGNMKYDLTRAPEGATQRADLRRTLGYADGDVVIIGGSLHEREDEALLDAFAAVRAANERTALIIVPRYPAAAATVEQHTAARGHRAVLKSALDAGRASAPGRGGVLIIDTLGELGRLYVASDLAFVGGSLFYRAANKGGHNLMEPAILAVPVLFGPYNFSFKETVADLLAEKAGIMVRDADELKGALARLVADAAVRRDLGVRGQRVVRAGQGASARNYELLSALGRRGALAGSSL
jgi:3-deoxy-D-manno-octulosonic-acid transferase